MLHTLGAVALAGCAPDARTALEPTVGLVSTERAFSKDAHGNRVFKGKSGRTFTIDHANRQISDDRGFSATVDAISLQKAEHAFDDLATFERKRDGLEADPKVRTRLDAAAHSKRHINVRATVGNPPASSPLRRTTRTGPSVPAFQVGSDYCTSIELAIYDLTVQYEAAASDYESVLAELSMAGWGFDSDGQWTWSAVRAEFALATLSFQLASAEYRVMALRVALDFLASQYQMAGCWGGSGGGDGGSGGGGGGGSQQQETCHYEWVTIEESDDGGVTWQAVDREWTQVCYQE